MKDSYKLCLKRPVEDPTDFLFGKTPYQDEDLDEENSEDEPLAMQILR